MLFRSDGFDLGSDVAFGRHQGHGVYLTENPEVLNMYERGESLTLRVNVKNPVNINDIWSAPRFGDILEELGGGGDRTNVANAITKYAQEAGYDSIIKSGMGFMDEIVVFDPKNVVVIK